MRRDGRPIVELEGGELAAGCSSASLHLCLAGLAGAGLSSSRDARCVRVSHQGVHHAYGIGSACVRLRERLRCGRESVVCVRCAVVYSPEEFLDPTRTPAGSR